jgi:hypothetical protein
LHVGGVCVTVGDHGPVSALLKHQIVGNYWADCKYGLLAIGGGERPGKAVIQENVFVGQTETAHASVFHKSYDTTVLNNTFYRGGFKIGRANCSPALPLPQGLMFKNNIFYETYIRDQTDACPTNDYQVLYNLFSHLPPGSRFERGTQAHNITGDPLFMNPGVDFHLQCGSPAVQAGEGSVDIGAVTPVGGANAGSL